MTLALSEICPVSPLSFFSVSGHAAYLKGKPPSNIFKKPYLLPDTSVLNTEKRFADVALAWNEEGIAVYINVKKGFKQSFFPQVTKGDSVELFFDTRDLKSAGIVTRFCHHFVFFPEPVEEVQAIELTRFRSEDSHPLADPSSLNVETIFKRSSYEMVIHIPTSALHFFQPDEFDRIGFTYRINRFGGEPQHFSVSSRFYAFEHHPNLWGTLKLVRGK